MKTLLIACLLFAFLGIDAQSNDDNWFILDEFKRIGDVYVPFNGNKQIFSIDNVAVPSSTATADGIPSKDFFMIFSDGSFF